MQGVPLFGYEAGFYGLCLLMAIGPQILGHGSFNYALHYFPAALVGMLALLEPVGSSALAFVLFGEVPNALAITGMLVVLGAVGVVVWNERQRAPADQER
jgi:drug/metabolite transporter (DMT)-like permease